ncbi:MAG: hypothetical protein AABX52_03525 [Nanoarchaeota archaeon]
MLKRGMTESTLFYLIMAILVIIFLLLIWNIIKTKTLTTGVL